MIGGRLNWGFAHSFWGFDLVFEIDGVRSVFFAKAPPSTSTSASLRRRISGRSPQFSEWRRFRTILPSVGVRCCFSPSRLVRWFRLILSLVGVRCCFCALRLRVEIRGASQQAKVATLREKSSLGRFAKSGIRDGPQNCSLVGFAKSAI